MWARCSACAKASRLLCSRCALLANLVCTTLIAASQRATCAAHCACSGLGSGLGLGLRVRVRGRVGVRVRATARARRGALHLLGLLGLELRLQRGHLGGEPLLAPIPLRAVRLVQGEV